MTQATEYEYDANGNMELDANKSITHIAYNHLNLPERVTFNNGKSVKYQYDAAGIKLRKETKEGNHTTVTDYVAGKHYVNDTLSFFPHGEGRVVHNAGTFSYEYNLTDHLGNVRVSLDAGGNVVQRDDYYPFGLTFQSWKDGSVENNYLYNQGTGDKTFDTERQVELQLDMTKLRMYDYALGRFTSIDPLADAAGQEIMTPYHYVLNNPVMYSDPYGDCPPNAPKPCIDGDTDDYVEPGTNTANNMLIGAKNALVSGAQSLWFLIKASSPLTLERQQLKKAVGQIVDDPSTISKGISDAGEQQINQFMNASDEERIAMVERGAGSMIFGLATEKGAGTVLKSLDAVGDVTKVAKLIDTTPGMSSVDMLGIMGKGLPDGSNFSKIIHQGKQGKHIVGHNNFIDGKSILNADAQSLLDAFHAGNVKSTRVINETKISVDFGQDIGLYMGGGEPVPTRFGTIVNSKTGVHIIPANPVQY